MKPDAGEKNFEGSESFFTNRLTEAADQLFRLLESNRRANPPPQNFNRPVGLGSHETGETRISEVPSGPSFPRNSEVDETSNSFQMQSYAGSHLMHPLFSRSQPVLQFQPFNTPLVLRHPRSEASETRDSRTDSAASELHESWKEAAQNGEISEEELRHFEQEFLGAIPNYPLPRNEFVRHDRGNSNAADNAEVDEFTKFVGEATRLIQSTHTEEKENSFDEQSLEQNIREKIEEGDLRAAGHLLRHPNILRSRSLVVLALHIFNELDWEPDIMQISARASNSFFEDQEILAALAVYNDSSSSYLSTRAHLEWFRQTYPQLAERIINLQEDDDGPNLDTMRTLLLEFHTCCENLDSDFETRVQNLSLHGSLLFSMQRYGEAADVFQRLVETTSLSNIPNRAWHVARSRHFLAAAIASSSEESEFSESAGILREVITEFPHFVRAAINLGTTYEAAGRWDLALRVYSEILKKTPEAEHVWLYVKVSARQTDPDNENKEMQEAISLRDPERLYRAVEQI